MGIRTWFRDLFQTTNYNPGELNLEENFCRRTYEHFCIMDIAIECAINLISSTLTSSKFKTFEKGKLQKADDYYLFNVQPNQNQNAVRFWKKVVSKLVYENECLVVQIEGNLYIADEFERHTSVMYPNWYSKLLFNKDTGEEWRPKGVWEEGTVFYFELHNEKIRDLLDCMDNYYSKLVEYSMSTYKRSNAKRGIFSLDMMPPKNSPQEEKLNALTTKGFKNFFEAENGAILTLTKGQSYQDLSNQTYKNGSDSRDIRSLIDDIFDYVAMAFQIPPNLLRGNVADSDNSWKNYMTFCINPMAQLLESEINRKYYKKEEFLDRTYLNIDTRGLRYTDMKDIATTMGLLTQNGAHTLNDNLEMAGYEREDNPDYEVRFMS